MLDFFSPFFFFYFLKGTISSSLHKILCVIPATTPVCCSGTIITGRCCFLALRFLLLINLTDVAVTAAHCFKETCHWAGCQLPAADPQYPHTHTRTLPPHHSCSTSGLNLWPKNRQALTDKSCCKPVVSEQIKRKPGRLKGRVHPKSDISPICSVLIGCRFFTDGVNST